MFSKNTHGDVTSGVDHGDPGSGTTAEMGWIRRLLRASVLGMRYFFSPTDFEIVVYLGRWIHSRLERSSATLGGTKHARTTVFVL